MGTLLIAFGLGDREALAAGLYYLPHSSFAAAALFMLAVPIARGRGTLTDRFVPGPDIPRAPLVGTLFFLCAILLAGLPPLSGFLGKVLLLQAALDQPGWPWILATVLTAGLLGLVALARSGSLLFFRSAAPSQGQEFAATRTLTGEAPVPGVAPVSAESACPEGVSYAPAAVVPPVRNGSPASGYRALLPAAVLLLLTLGLTLWAGDWLELTTAIADQLLQPHAYIRAVLGEMP